LSCLGGIPDRIKEDDMLAIFGSFGVIHHVNLPTDPETGMHTDKLN
jgi:RNA recognition motif-containing protein